MKGPNLWIANPVFYFVLMALYFIVADFYLRGSLFYGEILRRKKDSPSFHPGLEGLRGILALSVFFHHALMTYYRLCDGGWDMPASTFYEPLGSGSVTLFFFLTGFLFWGKALKNPVWKLRKFYLNRLMRLAPAYLASVIVIFSIAMIESGGLRQSAGTLIAESLRWISFGLPFGEFPAFNGFKDGEIINGGVAWTLRLEWIFYLVLPFMAWFASGRRILYLIAPGACALFAYVFLLPSGHLAGLTRAIASAVGSDSVDHPNLKIFRLLHDCIQWFGSGFLIGMLIAQLRKNRARFDELAGWPGMALSALSLGVLFWLQLSGRGRAMGQHFSLVCSALLGLVFLTVVYGNTFFGLLESRAAQFLGTISYSIYLFHGIALFIAGNMLLRIAGSPAATLAAWQYWSFIGLTGIGVILISAISYRFLEEPFT